MLLYISLTGIFISALLLNFNARKFTSSIYLGTFFLLQSLYGVNEYVILYSKSVFLVSLFATNIAFLSYLIGPMLYWYVRSTLTDSARLKWSDSWHIIPMVIYLMAAMPYMLSSYDHKVEIAKQIVQDSHFLITYQFTILSKLLSTSIIYLSRPLLSLSYTIWSIFLIVRFVRSKSFLFVPSGQYFMTRWLFSLTGLYLLFIVSHSLLIINAFNNSIAVFYTVNTLQILSAIGIVSLMFSPLFFPEILYGLPRFSSPSERLFPENNSDNEPKIPPLTLEDDYIHMIEERIYVYMEEHKPYLQSDLNLNRFADILRIPVHHLAFYYREIKKQSFNDYRNECRVNFAKDLMKDGHAGKMTLEAIGNQSGFLNRNTFLRAFKKVEGVTPETFASKLN